MIARSWLSLLAAAEGGGRAWQQALCAARDAETLLGMDAGALTRAGLGRDEIARLRPKPPDPPEAWLDWLAAPGHRLVAWGTRDYPTRLAEIADAPLALWADGTMQEMLADPQLAIVGSRNPTHSGRLIAESFAASLGRAGLTITSGLALGIDAASHRGALGEMSGTIAVLGNGIDSIYPASNGALAEQIRERGLIVSEHAPGTPVRAYHFPRRNRIIAALSLGTLVVEATRKSGSLITARLAAEYGREVFAIPGSIHSALSKGCHKLLREGAKLVEDTDDILVEIAAELRDAACLTTRAVLCAEANDFPAALQNCLDFSPITFDEMVFASGLTAAELSSMLLQLEIQGKIEALPGGRYCRLAKRA